jgi:cobalt-zinc-cadmium efflux system protein
LTLKETPARSASINRAGTTDHARHDHGHMAGPNADVRYLTVALALIVAFMIFEVAIAVPAHSLALLADAGHMLADAGALGASIAAVRLAARPPRGSLTFGLKRAEILSAQGNGITLLVVSALVTFEAVRRLIAPPAVAGTALLIVAGVGVAVNLAAVWVLSRANRESLNIEGSFRHIVTDLYAFVATLAAGAIIVLTGFTRADAIASLVVVALMLKAAASLLSRTGRILLEVAPPGIDVDAMGRDLASQPHVAEVHDVHLWTITSGFPALSAHVLVEPDVDCHGVRQQLEELLAARYELTHTTLQVDHVAGKRPISPDALLEASKSVLDRDATRGGRVDQRTDRPPLD